MFERPVVIHRAPVSKIVTQRGPRETSLQAIPSALVSLASSPLGSLLVLAGIVLVHESGHYLAARSFGIEVEEFSIGVGPKIFGFRGLNGDEFNLRAIPLGGYVRFPENYNMTAVRQQEEEAMKAIREFDKTLPEKNLQESILNVVTLGEVDAKRRVEEGERRRSQVKEKPSWWKGLLSNGKKDVPKDTPPEILDLADVPVEYYDDPNLLQNRPWQQRAVVLSGGVIFNLILSFFIYFGQINNGPGVPQPVFDQGAYVSSMPKPGAAASGILQKGDVVISVDGQPIMTSSSPSVTEATKGINNFISKIRSTPEDSSLRLQVLHPGSDKPVDVVVKPKRSTEGGAVKGPQTIGVLLSPNFVKQKVLRSNSVTESAVLAADYVSKTTIDTAKGLVSVLSDTFTGKGTGNQVSGPIGLIKTGSEVVGTRDLSAVLLFAAAISINLAVVNAFPLPALDGGQLLFVLAEAVTKRKVDQRVQEGITGATLFLLLLASLGAAFSDIGSMF